MLLLPGCISTWPKFRRPENMLRHSQDAGRALLARRLMTERVSIGTKPGVVRINWGLLA